MDLILRFSCAQNSCEPYWQLLLLKKCRNSPIEAHFMPCSVELFFESLWRGRWDGRKVLSAETSPTTISGQGLWRDILLKRREEPLPICRSILPFLHAKGLVVILVGAIFYSEQSLCTDLVWAVLPLQCCLWYEGAQVLPYCVLLCIWPSAGISPIKPIQCLESGLTVLYLFVSKKECPASEFLFIAESCHTYAIC